MKVKNVGTMAATITIPAPPPPEVGEDVVVTLEAGEISDNIDTTLARKLVSVSGGVLALASEADHLPEELEDADVKPQTAAWDPLVHVVEAGLRAEAEARKKAAEAAEAGESTTAPEPVAT